MKVCIISYIIILYLYITYMLYTLILYMYIILLHTIHAIHMYTILGLDDSVMERCFTGTSSRIKGADFNSIYTDMEALHRWVGYMYSICSVLDVYMCIKCCIRISSVLYIFTTYIYNTTYMHLY